MIKVRKFADRAFVYEAPHSGGEVVQKFRFRINWDLKLQ